MSAADQAVELVAGAAELARTTDVTFEEALRALTATTTALEAATNASTAERLHFRSVETDVFAPPANVYEALVNVANEVGPVRKSRETTGEGAPRYKFRGIDDVMNEIHASMARNGVLPVPFDDPNPGGDGPQVRELVVSSRNGKPWSHHTITTRWVLLGPNGSTLEVPIVSEALDNQDKGLGKARSYGMKDLLLRLLTLPTDDPHADNEATNIPEADGQRYDAQGQPARSGSRSGSRSQRSRQATRPTPSPAPGPSEAEVAAQLDADAKAAGFEDEAHRVACHNEVAALRKRLPDDYRKLVRKEHADQFGQRWPLTAVELASFTEFVVTTLETAELDPTATLPPAPEDRAATASNEDPDTGAPIPSATSTEDSA